ncbi:potassium channel family protein [Agromyces badenianii]|uniref:potassium channel family protein n=1 Tax=Agromyces badenianii TaxID=2080742 RepID=UPI00143D94D2|nr:potassium channel family protein [Agromyces badenianii]
MTDVDPQPLSPAKRRRLIALGLLRALASTAVLVALYFLVPFDLIEAVPVWATLTTALLVLFAVTAWQVRAITRSAHPRVRAIQALAITAPLYLLLFAAMYFVMANADLDAFSAQGLTRLDALYFTVTVFATVGFGDVSPTSQATRLLVMVQMILNLLVLGAGIQVLLGAVQRSRRDEAPDPMSDPERSS